MAQLEFEPSLLLRFSLVFFPTHYTSSLLRVYTFRSEAPLAAIRERFRGIEASKGSHPSRKLEVSFGHLVETCSFGLEEMELFTLNALTLKVSTLDALIPTFHSVPASNTFEYYYGSVHPLPRPLVLWAI